jgi:hypothetical protein
VLKRNAVILLIALGAVACSKTPSAEKQQGRAAGTPTEGSEAALKSVGRAVRVWSKERPTVDLVAAELEGVIMARTTAQALMHYDGYRIILMTPGEVVTRIVFQFDDEAKPSILQLTGLFGEPEGSPKGMLYSHQNVTTGQKINILAQPETMPVEDVTLVKGLIIEGARVQ